MSARFYSRLTFATALLAAVASASWEPAKAQTSPAPAGVDEAHAATQESPEALADGVAAIVDDTVISNYDVRQRVGLFTATSGAHPSADAMKQIREEVLKQLETERLQLLEAEKNKVSVTSAEVDKAIDGIITDNHLSMDQLTSVLSHNNVRIETLRGQIAAQIAWSKLVEDQLGDRVHVSELDVDQEMQRLRQGANKPHYLVSELFQTVDAPEQDAKVLKDMQGLEVQLNAGAPFSAVARQFSQNPTAAQGGDLGVVQDGQLPPDLDNVLRTMHTGQISQPIRSTGGYYILFLRERQEPEGAKLPDPPSEPAGPAGVLPLVRILLPVGPKPTKDIIQRAGQAAVMMRSQIQGCSNAKEVSSRLPGAVFMDLGPMRLADLNKEMQTAIANTPPGGASEPFISSAGIEVIVRCDKAVPQLTRFVMPTREQVENRIYEEQISTLARQYLRDLRRDADVETR